jgi:hypothetical protein
LAIGALCCDAIADSRLFSGRLLKYLSLSSAEVRSTLPSMRTWRSSSLQKNSRAAKGLPRSCWPFWLS